MSDSLQAKHNRFLHEEYYVASGCKIASKSANTNCEIQIVLVFGCHKTFIGNDMNHLKFLSGFDLKESVVC